LASQSRDNSRRAPRSLQKTMAGSGPVWRSRFSAKLRRAPLNQLAPGILSPSLSAGPSPRSAMTPVNSSSASQKSDGCATDQAHNAE